MRLWVAVIAAAAWTSPSAAQDGSELTVNRTPEGAHTFLNEFLKFTNAVAAVPIYCEHLGR